MDRMNFLEHLRQLFTECDIDGNGALGQQEFFSLCSKIGLSQEAARETFERLDTDKNGRITFDEFAAGFQQYSKTSAPPAGSGTSTVSRQSARLSPVSARARKTSPMMQTVASLNSEGASISGASSSGSTQVGSRQASEPFNSSLISEGPSTELDFVATGSAASSFSDPPQTRKDTNNSDSVVVFSGDLLPDHHGASSQQHYYMSGGGGGNDFQSGGFGSGQFGASSLLSNGSQQYSQVRNMQDLLDCVQKLQNENQILTQIFFKDKREREEYISQLGEEFDMQVKEVEERANRRAREELENEKKRLSDMMQAERETLQHHYKTIERMSKLIKNSDGKLNGGQHSPGEQGELIDKVKSKLDDTYLENRQLKKSLLDTKTDVAMIWREMENLKRQYEEKLSSAYERNQQTKEECDHIKQQLTLMKDSNRKLQDASDVITSYITDKVEPVIKIATGEDVDPDAPFSSLTNSHRVASRASSRRGSILSEYLNDEDCETGSRDDVESRKSTDLVSDAAVKKNYSNLLSVECPTNNSRSSKSRPRSSAGSSSPKNSVQRPSRSSDQLNGLLGSHDERQEQMAEILLESADLCTKSTSNLTTNISNSLKSLQERPNSAAAVTNPTQAKVAPPISPSPSLSSRSGFRNFGLHLFSTSRTQSEADNSLDPSLDSQAKAKKQAESEEDQSKLVIERVDGPIEASYDIMLVGDSFVGKSSLANRFVEGFYSKDTISTTSIDFRKRDCKVDGKNYSINIWDTAGQERFRSITAAYFRKAKGVILMYDVTDKYTYLNVRNWMDTISKNAPETVAVLLLANKIDLRTEQNQDSCVPEAEGFRLAGEYGIMFLETSVKSGANLEPAIVKLIRLIVKNNSAPVEEDADRIKLNAKNRTFACMPKQC